MRVTPRALAYAALLLMAAPVLAAEPPQPPIVDIHFHLRPWMTPGDLVAHMDRFNITRQGGGRADPFKGAPWQNRESEFKQAIGDRFIRATSLPPPPGIMGGPNALTNTAGFTMLLASMERDLGNGVPIIGEVHINSSNFAPPDSRRKLPADGPLMTALWTLAAKYDVPLLVHLELESDTIQQLEHLLATENPKTRLILAHCGSFTTASVVRPLLAKYANLNCDLVNRNEVQIPVGRPPSRIIFTTRSLDSGWKALIEDFPDRFAVGLDDVKDWDEYDRIAAAIRSGLLANLKPETARKVASANAIKWLKLE